VIYNLIRNRALHGATFRLEEEVVTANVDADEYKDLSEK